MVYPRLIIALCLIFISLATNAQNENEKIHFDIALCRTAPEEIFYGLEIYWKKLSKFVGICPLSNFNHKTILYILTFREDLWGFYPNAARDILEGNGVAPDDALIMNTNYQTIGHFLGQVPSDGPVHMEAWFTDWRDGYPWRIEFAYTERHRDGTPYRPPPPLLWNATNGVYQ